MPIAVLCPGCNSRLGAPDAAAGKTVKCPKCQTPMVIPSPDPAPSAGFEVVDEPAPVKKSSAAIKKPAPRPQPQKPARDEDDDIDMDALAKKKKPARDDDDDIDMDALAKKKKPRREDDDDIDRDASSKKRKPARDDDDERDAPVRKKKPGRDEEDDEKDAPPRREPEASETEAARTSPIESAVKDEADPAARDQSEGKGSADDGDPFKDLGQSEDGGGRADAPKERTRTEKDEKSSPGRKPGPDEDEDDSPRARRKSRQDDDDDLDDAGPRRGKKGGKPKKKGISGAVIGAIVGVCVLLFAGCAGLGYWIYSSMTDAADEIKKEIAQGQQNGPPPQNAPNAPERGSASAPAGWKAFTPKEGGIKAYFPGDPKEEKLQSLRSYEFKAPNYVVAVSVARLPEKPDEADAEAKEIKELLEGLVIKGLGMHKEKSRKEIRWLGETATEYLVEDEKKHLGTFRMVRAQGKIILAGVAAESAEAVPADIVKGFLDSIELAPDVGPAPPRSKGSNPFNEGPKSKDSPKSTDPKVPTGWKEFKPKDGSFKVLMPGNTTEINFGDINQYLCLTFNVSADVKIRPAVKNGKEMTLDEVIKETSILKKQVGERKETKLAGQPAVEFVLETTFGAGKGKTGPQEVVRILKLDSKYYVLTFGSTKPGPPPAEDVARFFDSFTLLK